MQLRTPLLPLFLLAACGSEQDAPVARFPIEPLGIFERDLKPAEAAARAIEHGPLRGLLEALRGRDAARLAGLCTPDFAARFPAPGDGRALADGVLAITELERDATAVEAPLDVAQFTARLLDFVEGWSEFARSSAELDRLRLAPEGDRATGRAELVLAGVRADGAREVLRTSCELELVARDGSWQLARVDLVDGTRAAGSGPPFRRIGGAAGLRFNESEENRALALEGVDDRRTLALGGLSVVDWNGDGFWDVIGTRRGQLTTLFLNDGAGGFTPAPLPVRAPQESGAFLLVLDLDGDGRDELVGAEPVAYAGATARVPLWTRGPDGWRRADDLVLPNPVGRRRLSIQTVVPTDVDADGDLDLFFAVYGDAASRGPAYNAIEAHDGGDNHLFVNQGELVFREESEARGISGTQYTYVAQAFDFDGDGDVDLYEGNDFGPNVLWENDGAGRFTANESLGLAGVSAFSMGFTIADYDNEGVWSLYTSNMSSQPGMRMLELPAGLSYDMRARVARIAAGNTLHRRMPDGTWRDHASEARCAIAEWAWGCTFFDPDNDGDKDLFVTNGFTTHSDPRRSDWEPFYWRQVLADAESLERGARSRDVNARVRFDGSFNGHERDRYFHNPDGAHGRFVEAAWCLGLDAEHDGRAVVPVDVDGDGDLDLVLWTLQGLVLYENRAAPRHFVRLALRAPGGAAGTLGAVVSVTAGGVTQRDHVKAVDGFQSQVPLELHFGLDAATAVEALEVRWPDGEVERWADAPADQRVVVTRGARALEAAPLPRWPDETRPVPVAPRVEVLVARADGGRSALGVRGRPVVVRFVDEATPGGPWPGADALAAAHPELRLVLVSLDAAGARALQGAPLAGSVVHHVADAALLESFFGDGAPCAATFVIDARGELVRAFRRDAGAAELARVLAEIADEPPFPDLLVEGGRRALREGRYREARALFLRALEVDEESVAACSGLAETQLAFRRPDLAEEAFRRAVALDPDYGLGHYNLGVSLFARKRYPQAVKAYEEALRVDPDDARAHLSLGEAALAMNDLERALHAYWMAGNLSPEDASIQLTRGKVLGKMGRYSEARDAFMGALELRRDLPEARDALALVERLLAEQQAADGAGNAKDQ
jgi:Tfp pilus assembly protein PilF